MLVALVQKPPGAMATMKRHWVIILGMTRTHLILVNGMFTKLD
jgi:hypothetical protein